MATHPGFARTTSASGRPGLRYPLALSYSRSAAAQPLLDVFIGPVHGSLATADLATDLFGAVALQEQNQNLLRTPRELLQQFVDRLGQHGPLCRRRFAVADLPTGPRFVGEGRQANFAPDIAAIGMETDPLPATLPQGHHDQQAPETIPRSQAGQFPGCLVPKEAAEDRLDHVFRIQLLADSGIESLVSQRNELVGEAMKEL